MNLRLSRTRLRSRGGTDAGAVERGRDSSAGASSPSAPRAKRAFAAIAALLLVCSVLVPVVLATDGAAQAADSDGAEDVAYEEFSGELESLAAETPDPDTGLSGERNLTDREQAAAEGAREGVELVQGQGVDVTQRQEQAAVDAAVRAASRQNASVEIEQFQAAAKGATHGALLQSQSANVTQLQAGVYGSAAGALSQSQSANVTQLQAVAYGAAHGTVAQHQRVNVSQMQYAAVGASAGAAHGAAQSQTANVAQLQEAAQGSAYGSLVGNQSVSVTQIQAAAFGAAGGGVDEAGESDPKKVQEASMGAAQGAVVQVQQATVSQVQAAARGACKGALEQRQEVSVTQIQQASMGAAEGAISQYQSASVTQIQAAATGAARGTLVQVQQVTVVQIQQAAAGAASGAAGSAAQNQVVDVRQIQAAAAGAGEGTVIQIQQINIVQIQVIAESAAGGALSQHQQASVVQIQSAARGAGEGAVGLTQRQTVTIEQVQLLTERAAADTAATAAEINVDNSVTIYNYARGAAGEPDEPDAGDELRSLFVSTDEETVFLANPNDVSVSVTITSEAGDLRTVTLAPGASTTETLADGEYTLTAETADGEDVELAGRDSLTVAIGEELRSLTATVDDGTLTVENPNDDRVTVTLDRDGARSTFLVPRNWEVSRQLDPGEYTLTAETTDGEPVPVNGEDAAELVVEADELRVAVAVEDGNVTFENSGDADVTVTATDESGEERTVGVAAGETVTESFEPGNYTLTAEADDREVLLNGQSEAEISVSEEPDPIDLAVSVEDGNVTFENPGDADVTITATDETNRSQVFGVSANETVTESFEPGNYTLTAEADEREVLLNGQSEAEISVPEEIEPSEAIDLAVSVDAGNVTVENAGDANVTVTASDEAGQNRSFEVPSNATVTEAFEPGNYTLTAEADDREVLLNGQSEYDVFVEAEEALEPIDLTASVEEGNLTVENAGDANVTVTAAADSGENRSFEVLAGETVTESFEPGNYTLTAEADDGRPVTFDGADSAAVAVEAAPEEGADRLIDSCTNVTEAGEYELTDDVRADDGGTCLRITASDVVLEGNGHAVEGPGPIEETAVGEPNAGVLVSQEAGTTVENVTIRNVSASGWNAGVQSDLVGFGGATDVSIEDSVVRDNDAGIELRGRDATVSNVTAAGNAVGVTVQEAGRSRLANVTVEDNDVGVRSLETDETRLESSVVRNNDGEGVAVNTGASAAMTNVTVTGNGGPGLAVRGANAGSVTIENATVEDNGGLEVDARDGSVTAVDLRVGGSATLAFEAQPIVLEPVAEGELPPLPENATAIGDGLNVTGLTGTVDAELDADAEAADAELWRHDGDEWSTADADPAVTDGAVLGTLDAEGVYAPVVTEAPDVSAPAETPAETPTPGEPAPPTAPNGTSPPSTPNGTDASEPTPTPETEPTPAPIPNSASGPAEPDAEA